MTRMMERETKKKKWMMMVVFDWWLYDFSGYAARFRLSWRSRRVRRAVNTFLLTLNGTSKWSFIFHHRKVPPAHELGLRHHRSTLANIKFNGMTFRLKNSIKNLVNFRFQGTKSFFWLKNGKRIRIDFVSNKYFLSLSSSRVRRNHFWYLWNINFNFSYSNPLLSFLSRSISNDE